MRLQIAGAVIVLAACVGAGASLAGTPGAAFGLCAALAIGGALGCLFGRTPTHSARALLATLFGTAGLFLGLGSDLLAVTQLALGAGGALLLLSSAARQMPAAGEQHSLARGVASLLIVGLPTAFIAWRCVGVARFRQAAPPGPRAFSEAAELGVALVDPTRLAVALEIAVLLLAVALVAGAYFLGRARATRAETGGQP